MRIPSWKFIISCFLLLSFQFTRGQDTVRFARNQLTELYTRELGRNVRLYNGSEYPDYSTTIREGHPFFESPEWVRGTVVFEGIEYQDIPLKYDLIYDVLTIRHFRSFVPLQPDRAKVAAFTIGDHEFIHLKPDTLGAAMLREGYYDRVYNGRTKLFVRRTKQLQEIAKGNDLYKEAIPREYYFIFREGKYHSVGNQRSMLAVFGDRKKDIQQHLKKNRIRYRSNKERALKEAVSYYDQITN